MAPTSKYSYPAQDAGAGDKPRNNDSMVLRASYGETSVLLEGDAEKPVERYLIAEHHPTRDSAESWSSRE